ncbi:MAG: hypothetical protein ACK6DX_09380 [Acidobacteriota bacterium]
MRFRVLRRQPARRINAVEHIVIDIEGEVETLTVVLDPAFEVEILGVGGGGEGMGPVDRAANGRGIGPFSRAELAVDARRLAGVGIEGEQGGEEDSGAQRFLRAGGVAAGAE